MEAIAALFQTQLLAMIEGGLGTLEELAKQAKEGTSEAFRAMAKGYFTPEAQELAANFDGKYLSLIAISCATESVSGCQTESEKIAKLRDIVRIFDSYGNEFYARLSPKMIDNVYMTATDPEYAKKWRNDFPPKNALVVLNKNDLDGAFYNDQAFYESLIDHGYNLIRCEANDEKEVAIRFFGNGLLDAPKEPIKYDLLVLGGHGTPREISFGKGNDEKYLVDLSDFGTDEGYGRLEWARMFNDGAKVVLNSCSTGAESEAPKEGNPGYFKNVMQMIAGLTGVDVYAPDRDAVSTMMVNGTQSAFDVPPINGKFDEKTGILASVKYGGAETAHARISE